MAYLGLPFGRPRSVEVHFAKPWSNANVQCECILDRICGTGQSVDGRLWRAAGASGEIATGLAAELKRGQGSHISSRMNRFSLRGLLVGIAALGGLLPISAFADVVGSDAVACTDPTGAAVRVHVTGFKNGGGSVRVQAYGPNPADFLATGKWIRRTEVRLQGRATLDVCLRLPGFGNYAVAVRHDANDNGKSDWSDGAGFSRNPKLSLFHLKPEFADVAVAVSRETPAILIVMNYRQGLSIGPDRSPTAR